MNVQSNKIQSAVYCHLHMCCPVPHDKRHLCGAVCCLELSRGRYCWEFFSVWNVILVPLWNYKPSIMSIRRAKHAGSWYTNDGGRTFNHEYFFFRRWTYWYNCSPAGVFKIFCCVFFSHRQNVARKLNAKLEEWLSKVHPTCRPAKAIIAP